MTPYNLGVLATYEGRLESESMLPSSVTRWAIHGLSARRRLGCVDLGSRRSSDRLKIVSRRFQEKSTHFPLSRQKDLPIKSQNIDKTEKAAAIHLLSQWTVYLADRLPELCRGS